MPSRPRLTRSCNLWSFRLWSKQLWGIDADTTVQRREGITDKALAEAISRAEKGLVDASLGGGLIKQRVARPGKGKSGGYRTIIAYREASRAVFLLGFAKSEQDNIDDDELADLKKVGAAALGNTEPAIDSAVEAQTLWEIDHDE